MDKEQLKIDFEKAVDAYVDALLHIWSDYQDEDPSFTKEYGHWVGNDMSGVYCYGDDVFISLHDIVYCVENNVSYDNYCNWVDYCSEAHEFGFTEPNLKNWIDGCQCVPNETFDRLKKMRQDFYDAVEIVKHNPEIKF